MELIYFISGVITVGAVYSAVYLRTVKSQYNDLLASLQSSLNISSIRDGENKDKLDELNQYIQDVNITLQKDNYTGVTELNKELESQKELFYKAQQRTDKFVVQTEVEIKKLYNELQNTKAMIRALKEDPNFNNRY